MPLYGQVIADTAVTNGLVAWYKDGDSNDYWVNGYDGSNVNLSSASVSGGTEGAGWQGSKTTTVYPSSGGYAVLPLDTIITGALPRTITMWINPNSTLTGSDYMFGFGGYGTGAAFNGRGTDAKMGFMGYSADYVAGAIIYSDTSIWTRIWYTYNGTNVSTFYTRNGTITSNWSTSITLNTPSSGTRTASIGAHASDVTNNNLDSNIRDFRIYDRVLSTADMQSMWDE